MLALDLCQPHYQKCRDKSFMPQCEFKRLKNNNNNKKAVKTNK